ncbi:unnamed protein product [Ixodes hexagonus]
MSKLIQPFKVGQDMGLYLVNFERACGRAHFNQDFWARRFLSVLPCEAAGVIARLSAEDSDDYECVKSCLLKKYRLSAEAFRQKFRSVTKKSEVSYAEFAYELRSYLIEWMKVTESYDDKEKILEVVALEQFYKTLPGPMRTWIQDKTGVDSVYKAADLADELVCVQAVRRGRGSRPKKEIRQSATKIGSGKRLVRKLAEVRPQREEKWAKNARIGRKRKPSKQGYRLRVITATRQGTLLRGAENQRWFSPARAYVTRMRSCWDRTFLLFA